MRILTRNSTFGSLRLHHDPAWNEQVGIATDMGAIITGDPWSHEQWGMGVYHNIRIGVTPPFPVQMPMWRPDRRTGVMVLQPQKDVRYNGWRMIVSDLLTRQVLRPTEEIEMLLGTHGIRGVSALWSSMTKRLGSSSGRSGNTGLYVPSLSQRS
jgi:hypothetical protein